METEQKNSICDSCANCNCSFQTGIYREKCDFYIPVKELGYAVVGIEHLRKYRQLQNDYEAMVKADLIAMLKELEAEIYKKQYNYNNRWVVNHRDISELINEKINSLKENSDVR